MVAKRIEARIVVRRVEGLATRDSGESAAEKAVSVEVKWKGQKGIALKSLTRYVKTNFTKYSIFGEDGIVQWDEEFMGVCNFLGNKDGFFPWELMFSVFNGLHQGLSSKVVLIGTASLNIADFAPSAKDERLEISIPLAIPAGNIEHRPLLCLSLIILELRTAQEPSETMHRSMMLFPLSPCYAASVRKNEPSALQAGLRKVKIFRDYLAARRAKKAYREEESSDSRSSTRSEDAECTHAAVDAHSHNVDADEESEASIVQQPFSYETLANAKCADGLVYSSTAISNENDALVHYGNSKSSEDSVCKQSLQQSSKNKILSWRKRKLGFRSPKVKGEPLLKKENGEEGGDDIDLYRRQISSSDESGYGWQKSEECSTTSRSSISEFGDDNFAVGSWEQKEVTSRDGQVKLQTQVFYASIDQRSERAAGESACTALVAVIADWLLSNKDEIPIKSEFDSLITDGSLEWRNLCDNEAYKERFPDRHFDLDTILQAKIRPLSVIPEKSFVGFFHPEGLEGQTGFDFLQSAMSFDDMWNEISSSDSTSDGAPSVYIISWNDHFFVLRVDKDAYYIIDTLGERLFEGCNQAYVLKFDKDTEIHRLPSERKAPKEKPAKSDRKPAKEKSSQPDAAEGTREASCSDSDSNDKGATCRGKESCKEYIKSFLAAIPIRELQADVKKGLRASSTPIHHRLQIEFHYTQFLQQVAQCSSATETTTG